MWPSISANGRIVAFFSWATNLVPEDHNSCGDVFVRDLDAGSTERVSVSSSGAESNGESSECAISADGQVVVFHAAASNLVVMDTNRVRDTFRHDRTTRTTTRVSVATGGSQANHSSQRPSISADSRFVCFWSQADNLVPNDANLTRDIFLHGPWLTLASDRESLPPGATLSLSMWIGAPAGLVLLAVVDFDGTPMFVPALLGTFDAFGGWTHSETIPPGLSGTVWTLQGFGIVANGRAAASNLEVLSFE